MGLFDRFRKRVTEVASEVDTDELSAEASSVEAQEALVAAQTQIPATTLKPTIQETQTIEQNNAEDEWEDLEAMDEIELPEEQSDDWDDFDDEEEITLPAELLAPKAHMLTFQ